MPIDFETLAREIKAKVAGLEASRETHANERAAEIDINRSLLELHVVPQIISATRTLEKQNIKVKMKKNYREKKRFLTREDQSWPSISVWCEIPYRRGRYVEKSTAAFFRAFDGHIEIGIGANQLSTEPQVIIDTVEPENIDPPLAKAFEFILTSYHSIAEVFAKRTEFRKLHMASSLRSLWLSKSYRAGAGQEKN
jgi:hypothetical protein